MNKLDLRIIQYVRDGLKDNRAIAGAMYAAPDDEHCPEMLRGWYKAGFYKSHLDADGETAALFKDKDEAVLWAFFRNHSHKILEFLQMLIKDDPSLADVNMLLSMAKDHSYKSYTADGNCGGIGTNRFQECLRCGREIDDLANPPGGCLHDENMRTPIQDKFEH